MNKMYLTLGDPSNDGHGQTEEPLLESNKTLKEVQRAYKDSCTITGIAFSNDICREYEDSMLSNEVCEKLEKFKCPLLKKWEDEDKPHGDGREMYPERITDLFIWFVNLSLGEDELQEASDDEQIPSINNTYGSDLFTQIGYGVFC